MRLLELERTIIVCLEIQLTTLSCTVAHVQTIFRYFKPTLKILYLTFDDCTHTESVTLKLNTPINK